MAKGLSDGVAQATRFMRHLSLTKETLVHRAIGGGIVLNFMSCSITSSAGSHRRAPRCCQGALRRGQQTGFRHSPRLATAQLNPREEVACIEKLTGSLWWQRRSPSVTVDRKIARYLQVLDRVLRHSNSLMFIDPNLDPSAYNYR